MKLTDIMFNLDYIAANTGATVGTDGNIFARETLTSDASGNLTLSAAPVPVVTNGTAYVYYRKSSENGDMEKKAAPSTTVAGFDASTEYCVMYRKAVTADTISISSQFIPSVLHAVLTVALYSGDNCNVESATKAGEVVIDIPRLQLSGAMDISMTATGAAQTPLEGNALASGCTGCDGKAVYATITKYISGANWYDDAQGIVIEDLSGIAAGATAGSVSKDVVVYAYYANKAPKKIANSELTFTFADGGTKLEFSDSTYKITNASNATVAGTATLKAVVTAKTSLENVKGIIVA